MIKTVLNYYYSYMYCQICEGTIIYRIVLAVWSRVHLHVYCTCSDVAESVKSKERLIKGNSSRSRSVKKSDS